MRRRLENSVIVLCGVVLSANFAFGDGPAAAPAQPPGKSIFSDDPDPAARQGKPAPANPRPANTAPPAAPNPLPPPAPPPVVPDVMAIDAVAKAAAKADAAQQKAETICAKSVIDARQRELTELNAAQKAAMDAKDVIRAAAIADFARGVQAEIQSIASDAGLPGAGPAVAGAPVAGPPMVRPRGKVVADSILITADDFVIDIYINGQRIADTNTHLAAEIFGATVMEVHADIHEGDCIVFNVANDRFRWGGSYGFAAAGLTLDGKMNFVTETGSGNWSACARVADVPRFIADPSYLNQQKAVLAAKPWKGCTDQMRKRCDWTGETIWGNAEARNVWIKYVVPGR